MKGGGGGVSGVENRAHNEVITFELLKLESLIRLISPDVFSFIVESVVVISPKILSFSQTSSRCHCARVCARRNTNCDKYVS